MSIHQRAGGHNERTAGESEKVVTHVESLERGAILEQIDKLEKADCVARRTFCLDDREGHGQSLGQYRDLWVIRFQRHGQSVAISRCNQRVRALRDRIARRLAKGEPITWRILVK
jgi:hypothetical protein